MKDVIFTVVDNGLFTELAVRLARGGAKVNYAVPWEAEFPSINDRIVGAGLPNLVRVEDPYVREIRERTDCYVFPDIFHAGKQQMLEDLGKRVWGGRTGDSLETKRIAFREQQKALKMPVPESVNVTGYENLVAYLRKHNEHCFIKTTSKIRGTMETHEFYDLDQDHYWLEDLQRRLGPARAYVQFLVEQPIETPFETGIDTYSIDGQVPKTPLQGIEVKGQLILCSAQTNSPTPEPLDKALSTLAPILKAHQYRNFLSAEFRGDILTDICCRCPNPGIGAEMEMIENLPEIIFEGAGGKLIEPKFTAEFGIQAAVYHSHEKELCKQFKIPPELRQWFKLMEFCLVGDLYQIVPRPPHGEKIGWIVGIGDTIEGARDHLFENADKLKGPFEIKLESLEEAVKQAHAMKEQGFPFTDQKLPEPEEMEKEGA